MLFEGEGLAPEQRYVMYAAFYNPCSSRTGALCACAIAGRFVFAPKNLKENPNEC
jgi:hypothetical protein